MSEAINQSINPFCKECGKPLYYVGGEERHELRHEEQYKANKWHFISQLWDMDIRTRLEVDAYVYDKRFCPEVISYIIHNLYELSTLGKIIGKILGRRTHKYSKIEILELVKLKMKEQSK